MKRHKNQHYFSFSLKSDILRGLNKKEYKNVCQWLRVCRNKIEEGMDIDNINAMVTDAMTYGMGYWRIDEFNSQTTGNS